MESYPSSSQATTETTTPDASLGEQAQQVMQQIPQKAGQLADQARDQMKTQLSQQKDRAAEGLDSVAEAFRQTGQHFQEQNQEALRGLAETVARQAEQCSSYLRERNVEEIVGQIEGFARRQPALFLGGAFAAGFLAARFLKSSSPYRDGQYTAGWESTGDYPRAGSLRSRIYPGEVSASMTAPGAAVGSATLIGEPMTTARFRDGE